MGIWDDADDVYLCSKQKNLPGEGFFFSMTRCTRAHITGRFFFWWSQATFRRDNSSSVYTSARGLGIVKATSQLHMYVARGGLCLFIEKNKIHLINLAFVGMVFIVHKAHITGFFFLGSQSNVLKRQ